MNEVLRISLIILTPLVGLLVGSFLNVVIYRLPNNMSLVKPASHCPKCGEPIKWYDNIPLLSYIFLGAKCKHCKAKISFRYPLVELVNAILWFLCLLLFTNAIIKTNEINWIRFGVSLVATSTLLCIFFVDLDKMEIPEVFQLILLLCGLVLLIEDPNKETIVLKVIGFIASGLLFCLVNLIFKIIKKRDGLGFGDVELVAVAGLMLGAYKMLYALLIACVAGGLILLILTLVNKDKDKEYPFAPWLVSGILIAMFTGDFVINWYLNLLGVN